MLPAPGLQVMLPREPSWNRFFTHSLYSALEVSSALYLLSRGWHLSKSPLIIIPYRVTYCQMIKPSWLQGCLYCFHVGNKVSGNVDSVLSSFQEAKLHENKLPILVQFAITGSQYQWLSSQGVNQDLMWKKHRKGLVKEPGHKTGLGICLIKG